jgi:tetratricopeptide (TPR) repeat protein
MSLLVFVHVSAVWRSQLAGPLDDIKAGNQAAQDGNLEKAIALYTKAIDSKQLSRSESGGGLCQPGRGPGRPWARPTLRCWISTRPLRRTARYAIAYYNRSFVYEKRGLNGYGPAVTWNGPWLLKPDDQDYQQRLEYLQFKIRQIGL